MPINLSGSLVLTGSLAVTGEITMSGSIASASYALSSSYAANADLLDNRDSSTFANTGSNIFSDGQYLSSSFNPTGFSTTASLYTDGGLRVTRDAYISGTLYLNNVTVFGTQSVAYISSSQLNIGTNLITVNTDTPSIRFGGLAVYDSGSTGLTGSILWDSETNHWIYSNPSGSTYSGGMFISGPRTSTLGSETGTTSCMLLAGQGGDHLTSSMIYHSSTVTCIPTAIVGGSTACFGGNVTISGGNDLVFRDASSYISSPATDTLRIVTANSERLRITATGIACFACQICTPILHVTTNTQIGYGGVPAGTGKLFISRGDQFGLNINVQSGYARIQGDDDLVAIGRGGVDILSMSTCNHLGIRTTASPFAALRVCQCANNNDYAVRIQAVFGINDYLDSDANRIFGGGLSETQFLNGSSSRPAMISLGGNLATSEALGVINFFRSDNASTYRSRAQIWAATNGSGCSTTLGGYITFTTADTGQTNPTQKLTIASNGVSTFACTVSIGAASTSSEANLFLGAQGTEEGGQMVFQKGTSCSCATHLDNYEDKFRIMSGTNTGSTTVNMSIDHKSSTTCFFGTVSQISSTADSAAKYGQKFIYAGSAFDNPLVGLYNAGSGTNAVAVVKVTVYQTAFGSQASNIQVGYATLMGQNASGTTTSMTIEYNGGIGSVGTLSWSGHQLNYQTNRVSNYDSYTIKVELAGSLGASF